MDGFSNIVSTFQYCGRRHAALAWSFKSPDGAGIRVLSRFEAEGVLRGVMHSGDSAELRGLYMRLSHEPSIVQLSNEAVLRWLVSNVRDELDLRGCFTLVELSDEAYWRPVRKKQEAVAPSPEMQRLTQALVALGEADLIHRGGAYRVLSVQVAMQLKNRDSYETLGEREARVVLKEMTEDPVRLEAQKAALAELMRLLDPARGGGGLLLLRRRRLFVRPADEAPVLTPSQLHKAREAHFIELRAVDPDGNPVAGVRLELLVPGGALETATTNEDGFARVERIQAGSVTVRVLSLDGSTWKPLGGAAAIPCGQQGPVRRHVVAQGECLSKIAHRHGLSGWRELWEHPKNESLRKQRKNPNVVYPGDELMVPRAKLHEIVRETDATHRIEIRHATKEVLVRVRNIRGQLLKQVEWSMFGDDLERPLAKGTSDGQGMARATLPAEVTSVRMVLEDPALAWTLYLGGLHEVGEPDSPSKAKPGLVGRLQGLGLAHSSAEFEQAVALFQQEVMNREDPGVLDAQVLDRLVQEYGV